MPDFDWKCANCGERNPPFTEVCRSCYQSPPADLAPPERNRKKEWSAGTAAAALVAFGIYLLLCAYVGWTKQHWPWLMAPPQLDILGLLAGGIGEPLGAFIASAIVGALGVAFISLGAAVAWKA